MKILFKVPVFSDDRNEDVFLVSVKTIIAFKGVEEMGSHYMLELDNKVVGLESIQQLFALFTAWDIDKSPLESLLQMVNM
ncbi:MAG: hypothetical protein JKX87_03590 [Cycloclasticus sp.]|nr:hypothetical protein [Cycloclasticus sp.]